VRIRRRRAARAAAWRHVPGSERHHSGGQEWRGPFNAPPRHCAGAVLCGRCERWETNLCCVPEAAPVTVCSELAGPAVLGDTWE
jgi:hypothetical protein